LTRITANIPQNGRIFDAFDILANDAGSLLALALSTWYHKRMLGRKRASKHYNLVPGNSDDDLEFGETVANLEDQESGVISATLEQEIDNWDENAEDWDDDDPTTAEGDDQLPLSREVVVEEEGKGRAE
jgi:hypothetical protein